MREDDQLNVAFHFRMNRIYAWNCCCFLFYSVALHRWVCLSLFFVTLSNDKWDEPNEKILKISIFIVHQSPSGYPILAHVLHAICRDLVWLCLHSTRCFTALAAAAGMYVVCGAVCVCVLCALYHPLDTTPWMCIATIRLQACSPCADVFSIDIHRFVSQCKSS